MTDGTNQHEGRLFSHSLLLMVSAQVANVSNVLFHMLMGWNLTAEQYGILAAMLNLLLVVATPLDALRGAMAHFTARAHRANEPAVVRALLRKWLGRVAGLSLPVALGLLVFRQPAASFFHLPTTTPIVLVAILLPGFLFLPVLCGALQGVQSFLWMAASMHGWGVVRLAAGWVFIALGAATATYGVASHAIGLFFGLLAGAWGVAIVTRGAQARGEATRGLGAYFIRSLVMLGAYGLIMNCDVMLVRHYLPDEAGHFAWAATIGRSVIFLPMPIALAMFPKVISTGGTSRTSRRTLLKAVGLVGGLIACAVGATWLLPWLPLLVLYKVTDPTPEQLHLVRIVVLAMSPLGLTYLLLNFEMAQHRFGTVPWLIVLAALYLGGVAVWHDTVGQIVAVLGIVSAATAAVYVLALLRSGVPRD